MKERQGRSGGSRPPSSKAAPRAPHRGKPHDRPAAERKVRENDDPLAAGLAARIAAAAICESVVARGQSFDDAADASPRLAVLEPRDRAFAHLIALTVLRRLSSLDAAINRHLKSELPRDAAHARTILRVAAAQIIYLATPPHAAISLAVDQCRLDRRSSRFRGLANAVLRRIAERVEAGLEPSGPVHRDIPVWLMARWRAAYGDATAEAIAAASLVEAPLDLTVRSDPPKWAERLSGTVLDTGSVRLAEARRVDTLDGFAEGAWWVQDAAAALPPRLLGDVKGRRVADLCAAPGGKTVLLAAAGARVTAVEASESRARLIRENLARLKLDADVIVADVLSLEMSETFDAVLLDAPCTATGTIRRHPDILHLKRPSDIAKLAELQGRLLDKAWRLLKRGGVLVYCTCSLESEEGVQQIERLLASRAPVAIEPIAAGEAGIKAPWLTPAGYLRTLPFHTPERVRSDESITLPFSGNGMDGFFAARLRRLGIPSP
ncbi:MAG TPA: transcription antitermination factor NusB [Hyphomicrobiaceae bacterium]|nr:transcription antitermination factor NusB [Hyphomicrobiaceae bacterium]